MVFITFFAITVLRALCFRISQFYHCLSTCLLRHHQDILLLFIWLNLTFKLCMQCCCLFCVNHVCQVNAIFSFYTIYDCIIALMHYFSFVLLSCVMLCIRALFSPFALCIERFPLPSCFLFHCKLHCRIFGVTLFGFLLYIILCLDFIDSNSLSYCFLPQLLLLLFDVRLASSWFCSRIFS